MGFAYEYAGDVFDAMSMEGRMTVCNMSIEGGARAGYVNPDETTYRYLKGRPYAPGAAEWEKALAWWRQMPSDQDAEYDDCAAYSGDDIAPMVTWGITPGQSVEVDQRLPPLGDVPEENRGFLEKVYAHMKLKPGQAAEDIPVEVVFIGSCTNGRIEDLRAAAEMVKGRKVHKGVRGIVVPGSQAVRNRRWTRDFTKFFSRRDFNGAIRDALCASL